MVSNASLLISKTILEVVGSSARRVGASFTYTQLGQLMKGEMKGGDLSVIVKKHGADLEREAIEKGKGGKGQNRFMFQCVAPCDLQNVLESRENNEP